MDTAVEDEDEEEEDEELDANRTGHVSGTATTTRVGGRGATSGPTAAPPPPAADAAALEDVVDSSSASSSKLMTTGVDPSAFWPAARAPTRPEKTRELSVEAEADAALIPAGDDEEGEASMGRWEVDFLKCGFATEMKKLGSENI